ncbi:hypothetical protein GJ744_001251 [Endocarpon pusillum]|uniref:Uncharacterized protein n=1 Tax=Endocarpon pusillum TaxID=364733 RepID=A0A8H7ADI0_9EURO|nr:hypothetical protein GJ744_001251 [Endocarpon pusillum]
MWDSLGFDEQQIPASRRNFDQSDEAKDAVFELLRVPDKRGFGIRSDGEVRADGAIFLSGPTQPFSANFKNFYAQLPALDEITPRQTCICFPPLGFLFSGRSALPPTYHSLLTRSKANFVEFSFLLDPMASAGWGPVVWRRRRLFYITGPRRL